MKKKKVSVKTLKEKTNSIKHFTENKFNGFTGRIAPKKQISPDTIVSPTSQVGSLTGNVTVQSVPTLPTLSGQLDPIGQPKESGYGRTGTTFYGGWIAEDNKHDLEGRDGILMFDQMYKSDYQVYTSIERGNSKIKEANWYIEPDDEKDEQSRLEAQIISKYLLIKSDDGIDKTWLENLTEILTYRHLGLGVFEPLWQEVEDNEHGRLWVWSTLGYRSAKSLWQAYFAGNKLWSIRQISYGDDYNYVDIPGNEVLIFTYNKTGNNIYGPPPTRRMYGPYIRKNNAHMINSMGIENSARGVIHAEIPEDKILTAEASNMKNAVNEFALGQQPAIFTVKGWPLTVMDLKYNSSPVQESIRMEDASISKTTENEQAEMGLTEVGSRGMHAGKQENSDRAIKVDAKYICEVMQQTINMFIDLNFPKRKRKGMPKLNFTGIDTKAGLDEAQKDKLLTDSGWLDKNNKLHKAYMYKKYDIPGGEEIEDAGDDKAETKTDNVDTTIDKKSSSSNSLDNSAIDIKSDNAGSNIKRGMQQESQEHAGLIKQIIADTKAGKIKPIEEYVKEIVQANLKTDPKQYKEHVCNHKELSEIKMHRQLTEYEKKINFTEIDKTFKDLNKEYICILQNSFKNFVIEKYKSDLFNALKSARNQGAKAGAIAGLELGKKKKVKQIIKDFIMSAIIDGRRQAKSELAGFSNKKNFAEKKPIAIDDELSPAVRGWVEASAEITTESQYATLQKKLKLTTLNSLNNNKTDEQIVFEAGEAGDEWADDIKNLGDGFTVSQSVNEGRFSMFQDFKEEIQGFQFSALLENSCDLCIELDQLTFDINDPDSVEYTPPLHANCACILVPIMIEEEEPEGGFDGLDSVEGIFSSEELDKLKKLKERK